MSIEHRKVGVESHKSNGRVERSFRTFRDYLVKMRGITLGEKVKRILKAYNNTYHVAIRCTPAESINDVSEL